MLYPGFLDVPLGLVFSVAYLQLTMSDELIPERADLYYVNKKYLSNATFYIRRTGRRSPYYINFAGTTLDWWGNNVTVHGIFYEFLHNEYKRSFVEIDVKLCEFINKEPWHSLIGLAMETNGMIRPTGTAQETKGLICPTPPGTYTVHNITVSMKNFPYVLPFEKCMLEAYGMMTPTREMIAKWRFYLSFKRNVPKGK